MLYGGAILLLMGLLSAGVEGMQRAVAYINLPERLDIFETNQTKTDKRVERVERKQEEFGRKQDKLIKMIEEKL
jgi:hypothetical protein